MSNGEGPIYHGYTQPVRRTLTLFLPVSIPGYGLIESADGWMTFITWMKHEMDAHKRTLDSLAQATAFDDIENEL